MIENKDQIFKKSLHHTLSDILSSTVLICAVSCVMATMIALTLKFILWLF